jgi:hypothetical protein
MVSFYESQETVRPTPNRPADTHRGGSTMRKLILILGVLALAALDPASVRAQETGQELTLRGCLVAQTDDAGTKYVLQGIGDAGIDADHVDLVPAEGVQIGAHAGHTVEVSGTAIAERAESAETQEEGDEEDSDHELALQVTELTHIAASCAEGDDG